MTVLTWWDKVIHSTLHATQIRMRWQTFMLSAMILSSSWKQLYPDLTNRLYLISLIQTGYSGATDSRESVYKTYGTYKLLQLMGNTTFENGWLDPGPLMAPNEGTSSLPPRPVRSKQGLDTCHYLGLGRIQRLAEVWNPIKNCHFILSSCHTFETHILLENQSQGPELAGDWPSDIQTLTVSH